MFSCFGSTRGKSVGVLTYHSISVLLHLGALGLNAFNHPLAHQVSYVFPPPALVPLVLSKFLTECVTGQFRVLILVAPCWRFLGLSQFSKSWQTETPVELKVMQTCLHQPLECSWDNHQSQRHRTTFVKSQQAYHECCQWFGCLIHLNLPVALCKGPCHGCFGRLGVQGSAIVSFNTVATQRCVLHRYGFSFSVRQWWG